MNSQVDRGVTRRKRQSRSPNKRRNKFEDRIDHELALAKMAAMYEAERLPYVLAKVYIPDWTYLSRTSRKKIYIETKGYLRPEDKTKLRAVKKQHPDIDLRIIFYAYKLEYIKWANKHGFPYAIGSIPEEWLNE